MSKSNSDRKTFLKGLGALGIAGLLLPRKRDVTTESAMDAGLAAEPTTLRAEKAPRTVARGGRSV